MKTHRGIIEAPRWAKVEDFLKDICWSERLELITYASKGILRETIRFEIAGDQDNVDKVSKIIYDTLSKWNRS